jgi:hypothetical protein
MRAFRDPGTMTVSPGEVSPEKEPKELIRRSVGLLPSDGSMLELDGKSNDIDA